MTKKVGRFVGALLIVLVLVYFAFQIYMVMYPAYKTEAAVSTTVSRSLEVKGIVVRDETIIETDADGIKNYLVSDGEKIAKGANVAEVYLSSDAATKRLRLSAVDEELTLLKNLSDLGRTSGTNINSLTSRIYENLSDYSKDLAKDNFSTAKEYRMEMLQLLNSFALAAGNEIDLSARIAELENEASSIKQTDMTPNQYITTPLEGYFVSSSDGYEALVDKAGAKELSVSALRELLAQESETNNDVCKIISDYKWYFVFETDAKNVDMINSASSMSVSFNYASVNGLPVKVVDCSVDDETGTAKVIVEGVYLNSDIATLRVEEATIDFQTFSGIKVDRKVLRIENDELGVYVKFGAKVLFKKIEPIFETEDYVLAKPNSSDDDYLELYDEIIVEGKDLYAGKELGNR